MKQNRRILKIVIPLIVIVCSGVFVPWDVLWLWVTPTQKTIQEQVNDVTNHGLDGVVLYIDKKNKKPQFFGGGLQNRALQTPINPQSLFKIASISKLYIAVAAAKLIDNKSLSLDKTLVDYLPEFAGRIENAEQITLRMLLQHRSGIPDFIDSPKLPWSKLPTDANKFLDLVLGKPADFKPDSQYAYSNTNYLLIGNIIDKKLGYSHRQYIKQQVLAPIGLTHTYGLLNEVNLKDVISGYYTDYNGDLKSQNYVSPGGSMVATAQDVGGFVRALNDGSLLSKDEQAIYSAIYVYEHTGLLPGYSSIARYFKDIDTVVILFVNTSGGNSWTKIEMIYSRLINILRNQKSKG